MAGVGGPSVGVSVGRLWEAVNPGWGTATVGVTVLECPPTPTAAPLSPEHTHTPAPPFPPDPQAHRGSFLAWGHRRPAGHGGSWWRQGGSRRALWKVVPGFCHHPAFHISAGFN